MTQYNINKAALVAEIEKYISNYKEILNKVDKSSDDWVDTIVSLESKIDVLQHILSFLNTLEVKEVDLDAEWVKYFENRGDIATVNIKHLAKYFFELGLKAQKGEK